MALRSEWHDDSQGDLPDERSIKTHHIYVSFGHGDSQGDLPDERSMKTHRIYVSFGLRLPIYTFYSLHCLHIFVFHFFISGFSQASVLTAKDRRKCIAIIYDSILWSALLECSFSRESIKLLWPCIYLPSLNLPVRLVSAVGEFPDTCEATEIMHGLRRKNSLWIPVLCSLIPSLCSTLRA